MSPGPYGASAEPERTKGLYDGVGPYEFGYLLGLPAILGIVDMVADWTGGQMSASAGHAAAGLLLRSPRLDFGQDPDPRRGEESVRGHRDPDRRADLRDVAALPRRSRTT